MGGLAVDVSDIHNNLSTVVLTPRAVIMLARRGHFIMIPDGDIRDKSKADVLAKGLVILQVSWMILQSVSRAIAGYPLSPLEVHTLVHAGCAMLMYAFWFRKPLDVRAPTLIPATDFQDFIALLLVQNPVHGTSSYDQPSSIAGIEVIGQTSAHGSEATYLMFDDRAATSDSRAATLGRANENEILSRDYSNEAVGASDQDQLMDIYALRRPDENAKPSSTTSPQTFSKASAQLHCGPTAGICTVCDLKSGDVLQCGIGLSVILYKDPGLSHFRKQASVKEDLEPFKISDAVRRRVPRPSPLRECYQITLSLSKKDLRRWTRASRAFAIELERTTKSYRYRFGDTSHEEESHQRYRSFNLNLYSPSNPNLYEWGEGWESHTFLARRIHNFDDANVEIEDGWRTGVLVMWLLGSLYGGVHLALWNYHFPTRIEGLLWKISAVVLGTVPVLAAIFVGTVYIPYLFEGLDISGRIRRLRKGLKYPLVLSRAMTWTRDVLMEPFPKSWKRRTPKPRQGCVGVNICPSLASATSMWIRQLGKSIIAWISEMFKEVYPILLGLFISVILLLYTFGRIFLVVESFMSLRHVPIGVYTGVTWAEYIPHL